jgi:hypothetical protein
MSVWPLTEWRGRRWQAVVTFRWPNSTDWIRTNLTVVGLHSAEVASKAISEAQRGVETGWTKIEIEIKEDNT